MRLPIAKIVPKMVTRAKNSDVVIGRFKEVLLDGFVSAVRIADNNLVTAFDNAL